MDFVALDFETANEDRGSACEIGLVRFSGAIKRIRRYFRS